MKILEESKKRWFAETPPYFKKLKTMALTLGGSASAIWAVNESMSLELPQLILTVCKYLITLSTGIGVTAQLTKVDNPKEQNL